MKIRSLKISGIGGIRELDVAFNPSFNVICGPNGIGKTTILKTIANAFATDNSVLKKNASYEKGKYTIRYIDIKGKNIENECEITVFNPLLRNNFTHVSENTNYVMFFKENRSLEYKKLQNIPRDPDNNIHQLGYELENGIHIDNIKGWFGNRCVFENLSGSLSEIKLSNLEMAKRSFSILDPSVKFSTIDASTLDIMLSSPNGNIYFEYLSAGYKSCIFLILGLIKEIEFRFGEKSVKAEDFAGVILIDEIDLHLHPAWQAKLVETLKMLFPKAQFIVTTHSPSVLQTLKKDEIIPITGDFEGNVSVKELNLTEFGLQGWTIEEILRDVMEMPETTSTLYEDTKKKFEKAMQIENIEEVKKQYLILEKMLHPDSIIKKLIKIQMAGLEE